MRWLSFRQCGILLMLLIGNLFAQEYFWPTNSSHLLSSSFGEYRSNHFHAGIDIKTFGQEGFPVFAVRSGWVKQLRVSPYGYGRALYLQLETGEVVVFGHLQRFAAPLEEMIAALQLENGCFTVSKKFKPRDFPVSQGEILAYTGQSGIGPPHLHFELRDSLNRPINPLAKPYDITDTQPPVVRKLAVIPLSGGTQINGRYDPKIYRMHRGTSGHYHLAEPLHLFGRVGLAVETYDPLDQTHNKLGVYRIQMWLDDALVYDVSYDRFSYARTQDIALIYDSRLKKQGAGRFHRCFKDPAIQLEMFDHLAPGAGMLASPAEMAWHNPSHHSFQIELTDYAGNTSRVSGQFVWEKQQQEPFGRSAVPAKNLQILSVFQDGWIDFEVIADQPLNTMPQLRLIQPGAISRNIPLAPVDATHFHGYIDFTALKDGVMFLEATASVDTVQVLGEAQLDIDVVPLSGKIIKSADGRCQMTFPEAAVYRPVVIQNRVAEDSLLQVSDYCFAGKKYHFATAAVPFHKSARLTIQLPDSLTNVEKWGIYASGNGEKWHFSGNRLAAHKRAFTTSVRSLNRFFTLVADTMPPEITALRPANAVTTRQRRPRIQARIEDELSGFRGDAPDLKLFLDGKFVIGEFDPERDIFFYQPKQPLAPGIHTIRFQVTDRCGNVAEKTSEFTVL